MDAIVCCEALCLTERKSRHFNLTLLSSIYNSSYLFNKSNKYSFLWNVLFNNYAKLMRSVHGPDGGAPEWARLQTLIPAPPKLPQRPSALDLGCGYGWYSRWLVDHRCCSSVHGIDVSQNMLDRAETMTDKTQYPNIAYQQADLDDPTSSTLSQIEPNTIDLALSILCLHYLVNLKQFVSQVHRILKPGASFVVSVEHPIRTAPTEQRVIEIPVAAEPGNDQPQVRRIWPLDNYQLEGLRVRNWLADGVRLQHRTVSTYINIFLEVGFELTGFNEWYPTKEELEAHPDWVEECKNETIKPTFLLMRVTKRG